MVNNLRPANNGRPILSGPPLEEVIHPGLRGSVIAPTLDMDLSNSEFRAYRNGAGFVVMHHRSFLLIASATAFSLDAYFHGLAGSLELPEREPYDMDEFSYAVDLAFRFDRRTMAYDFSMTFRPGLRDIAPCVGRVRLQLDLNVHGAPLRGKLDRPATVVRRYKCL